MALAKALALLGAVPSVDEPTRRFVFDSSPQQ
jgi:hypothetical protein